MGAEEEADQHESDQVGGELSQPSPKGEVDVEGVAPLSPLDHFRIENSGCCRVISLLEDETEGEEVEYGLGDAQ